MNTELYRLNIYLRFLIKKIEIAGTGGVDLTDKVLLQYYKLAKQPQVDLYLDQEENTGLDFTLRERSNRRNNRFAEQYYR